MLFTKHEAALLLFYLLQVLSGEMQRKEAAEKCSAELRHMAVVQGMTIDSEYRNTVGIRAQMDWMESAYRGKTVRTTVVLNNNIMAIKDNIKHVKYLEDCLINDLKNSNINFVKNGGENTLPGLISVSFPYKNGEAIMHRLDLMGISVSTGSACNSHEDEISHVLKAICLPNSLAKGTIRISLGKDNKEEDVGMIVAALKKIV